MNDPIHKTITVPLAPPDAFALFTDEIGTWWPATARSGRENHHETARNIRFGAHKGDKIVETTDRGDTVVWGEIIAYDPGRFIAFTWHRGLTRADATVVKVSFRACDQGTQCDLTHGGFDILGPLADAVSTSYLRRWDIVLGSYFGAAQHFEMA